MEIHTHTHTHTHTYTLYSIIYKLEGLGLVPVLPLMRLLTLANPASLFCVSEEVGLDQ